MKSLKISFVAVLVMLFGSCSLDEQTYTITSGEDLVASGSYGLLVAGAYNMLHSAHEYTSFNAVVNFDTDYDSGPAWAFGTIGAGNFYEEGSVNNVFKNYSMTIHRANYHAYLIAQMDIDPTVRNNAIGELRFLKAWCQFLMVQLYGGIPLFKTSINEGNQPILPRSSVADVYAHIIETLKDAESMLYSRNDEKYIKGHVCRGSAKALLAKVYATIGSASMKSGNVTVTGGPGYELSSSNDKIYILPVKITHAKSVVAGFENFDSRAYYTLARDKALEVITDGEFELALNQQALWSPANKNGKEFQFCLQTAVGDTRYSNSTTKENFGYPDAAKNGQWGHGYYIQRDHWLQMFTDWDDERITWGVLHRWPFYYETNTGVMQWCYYPARDSVYVNKGINGYKKTDILRQDHFGSKLTKFLAITAPNDGGRTDYNWPFMRYAETILFYAEAENELNGPNALAMNELKKLNARNNSSLVDDLHAAKPFTKESFRSYIIEERAKEFAAEGIRHFDLKRWGIYLQVMNSTVHPESGKDEKDVNKRRENKHLLMPLPADEVSANPLILTNNPGW